MRPNQVGKGVIKFKDGFCVSYCGLNLGTVSNDALIFHQSINVLIGHFCNPMNVEIMKGFSKSFAALQNSYPRKPRLETLQGKLLKKLILAN